MKLKPCPFCGRDDVLRIKVVKHDGRPNLPYIGFVTCLNCFGRIMSHDFCETEELAQYNAIFAWNQREYKE